MNNEPNFQNSLPQNTPDPQNEKRCPVCGKAAQPAALFCGECGYSFDTGNIPTAPRQTYPQEDRTPLKTFDYLLMLLVSSVPFVGFVLMLLWAFSSGVNIHRRNFCRAYLIYYVIASILLTILSCAMLEFGVAPLYY